MDNLITKIYKIVYKKPDTEEFTEVIKRFEDSEDITAYQWAKDYAYSVSDKGDYTITEYLEGVKWIKKNYKKY